MNEDQMLTVRNYKEPLLKIPKTIGVGYYGTISQTLDGDKIQCHICGQLFRDLATHIRQKHETPTEIYRGEFKLAAETSLNSDTLLEEKKERTMTWLNSMTEDEKDLHFKKVAVGRAKEWERRKKIGWKGSFCQSLETQNKRGSCPDQILAKITEVVEKLGRTPSLEEFNEETGSQRYRYLIEKVYGSWTNALKILKITPKERFSTGRKQKYTEEELLEYLRNFAATNHKIPTCTDFKRQYLPSFHVYIKTFGNIENARQLAGVYNYVTEEQVMRVRALARNK